MEIDKKPIPQPAKVFLDSDRVLGEEASMPVKVMEVEDLAINEIEVGYAAVAEEAMIPLLAFRSCTRRASLSNPFANTSAR